MSEDESENFRRDSKSFQTHVPKLIMSFSSVRSDKMGFPNLLCSTLRVIVVLSLTAFLERGECQSRGPDALAGQPHQILAAAETLRSSLPDSHKNSVVMSNYNPSILISS